MKRQRRATGVSPDSAHRPAVVGLQAASGSTKASSDAIPRYAAESGPDGRIWARYIDSRMKQFGTR